MAGRLRKFFYRCHDWGLYDKQSIKIKRENDIKKIMPYDWSRNQRDNINVIIDLAKNDFCSMLKKSMILI